MFLLSVYLSDSKIARILMTVSGNVDYGPRNRWLNFGDFPDDHFGIN